MSIISWVIFGALAGWVASIIAGNNRRQGCLMNVIVGIAGAFVGGFLIEFLTGWDPTFQFNVKSFVVAVIGAVLLLVLTGAARRRR